MKSVSDELRETIEELMKEPLLDDFNLGGGTNLALKYNHRISTDIDLFSQNVVGAEKMIEINDLLLEKYSNNDISSKVNNRKLENLSHISSFLQKGKVEIKIDIVQNLALRNPIEKMGNIRLIHDLDIGSLKLLSAADRKSRKDFYDLYLLSQIHTLPKIYDELIFRHNDFDPTNTLYQNIFNIPTNSPKEDLKKSLTPLGDFNKANNQNNPNNRLYPTPNEIIDAEWYQIEKIWIELLEDLAKNKNLLFEKTPKVRAKKKKFGLFFFY